MDFGVDAAVSEIQQSPNYFHHIPHTATSTMTQPTFYPANGSMPFSTAVRIGDSLLLSGQIPFDFEGKPHSGTIEEQTHAVLQGIAGILQCHGSDMAQVVKATVWLSDLANFVRFNGVYQSYFTKDKYPVRSLIQAQLVFGVGVEIEVQAYLAKS